ncbi:MAG: dTDP-glucose 4,6-dehydratase [Pirellulales bacterium]
MSRTILVTGGAGFIGGTFVRKTLANEPETRIINLDRLTYAGNLDSIKPALDHPNHTFVHGDIGDAKLVANLLALNRPSAIIHFAAESHVDRSIDGPMAFLQTNVVGTATLLEAARKHWMSLAGEERAGFRFVHVSTDEVYGSLGPTGYFVETTPYSPNSPYSASKAASDHFVRAYHHTYGLPTLITNCSNNYGPFQFPEKLIPLMILNALEGTRLPVYGDGGNIRDWLFVEDHCCALSLVLERGEVGETYNIGGGCERTNLQIVHAICDQLDRIAPPLPSGASRRSLVTFVQDRPGHDRRYAIDATKIERELGWRPTRVFETGLEATIAWYLGNRSWIERITSGIYRRERLGLGVAS